MSSDRQHLQSTQNLYHEICRTYYDGCNSPSEVLRQAKPEDWENLCWLTRGHHTSGFLFFQLEKLNVLNLLPVDEKNYLAGISYLQQNQEANAKQEIAALLLKLKEDNITALPVKGAALLMAGYHDFRGARFLSDIDFIVPKNRVDDAVDALETIGYRFDMSVPRPIQSYLQSKHVPQMKRAGAELAIECHQYLDTGVFDRPIGFDHQDMCIRRQQIELTDSSIAIPGAEHLIMHAFHHSQICDRYGMLGIDDYRAMLDVVAIVRSAPDIDWPYINDILTATGCLEKFALFIDRIQQTVYPAADAWPVKRDHLVLSRLLFTFKQRYPAFAFTLENVYFYYRAPIVRRFKKRESAVLKEVNPNAAISVYSKTRYLNPVWWFNVLKIFNQRLSRYSA